MSLLNPTEPIFRLKQPELDVQDLRGLFRLHWRIGSLTVWESHYTRVDQACLLWGLLIAVMFVTAQFFPIPWTTQAILWSALTLVVTSVMVNFTWFWATVEKLRWLILTWAGLVALGIVVTDYSIFARWGWMMGHLCHLWLGLSAIGYAASGWGLQSRSLVLLGASHVISCYALNFLPGWHFLATGIIMTISLVMLGEYQWDMHLAPDYEGLTAEEEHFNQLQQQLRQMGNAAKH